MAFSIFRYAALNKLSEDEYDDDDNEGPVDNKDSTTAHDVDESNIKHTEIKNNFVQNVLGPTVEDDEVHVESENKSETVKIDDEVHVESENKSETVKIEPELDTKIKGGDQLITYDVSFISAFPFIVAKASC